MKNVFSVLIIATLIFGTMSYRPLPSPNDDLHGLLRPEGIPQTGFLSAVFYSFVESFYYAGNSSGPRKKMVNPKSLPKL